MFDHVDDPRLGPRGVGALLRTVLRTLGIEQTHTDERLRRVGRLLARRGRRRRSRSTRRPAHRLRRAVARARRRVLARRHRGRLPRRRRARARGRSTATTTTAPSCSIPTATAPRPCTTARCATAATSTTSGSASPTSRRRSASTRRSRRTPASALEQRHAGARAVRVARAARSRSLPRRHADRARPHRVRRAPTTRPWTRFHRAATEAGYRDNGAPGERPIYHAGLLRRLRARPRRQQRRGRQPQPLSRHALHATTV